MYVHSETNMGALSVNGQSVAIANQNWKCDTHKKKAGRFYAKLNCTCPVIG